MTPIKVKTLKKFLEKFTDDTEIIITTYADDTGQVEALTSLCMNNETPQLNAQTFTDNAWQNKFFRERDDLIFEGGLGL